MSKKVKITNCLESDQVDNNDKACKPVCPKVEQLEEIKTEQVSEETEKPAWSKHFKSKEEYMEFLLNVPVATKEDLKGFAEARKYMKKWKIRKF